MQKVIWSILTLFMCLAVNAELKLPAVFGDSMVLQQKQPIPVWGWTAPNTEVTVSFKGQKQTGKAGNDGKWMVKLTAVDASAEAAEMTVGAGSDKVVIKDILVGEVWLCGGQSNMDYSLLGLSGSSKVPAQEGIGILIRQEIEAEDDPLFRQIKVPKVTSPFEELTDFKGTWVKSLKGVRKDFTATGYYFGKELRKKLGVPVGLLNCNWGGTMVEPWIPMSKFQKSENLKKYYETATGKSKEALAKWDPEKAKANYEEAMKKWKNTVAELKAKGETNLPKPPKMADKPGTDNRFPSTLYNAMVHPLVP